jgi:hypothetical protein
MGTHRAAQVAAIAAPVDISPGGRLIERVCLQVEWLAGINVVLRDVLRWLAHRIFSFFLQQGIPRQAEYASDQGISIVPLFCKSPAMGSFPACGGASYNGRITERR